MTKTQVRQIIFKNVEAPVTKIERLQDYQAEFEALHCETMKRRNRNLYKDNVNYKEINNEGCN